MTKVYNDDYDDITDDLYLGIDVGTQSMKAYLINSNCKTVEQVSVDYDRTFPHYGTVGGVHQHENKNHRVTVPPIMWIEAVDTILKKLDEKGCYLPRVRAIATSGQQHGSVYWKNDCLKNVLTGKLMHKCNSNDSLYDICKQYVSDMFVCDSPIWMDSSTSRECSHLEQCVGGKRQMIVLTGSCATERFTGSHIHRLYNDGKDTECERISLVSSFIPSLFLGRYADIDYSDASGMNLLDINSCTDWSTECLEATSNHQPQQLARQLGTPTSSLVSLGTVSEYMQNRYKFPQNCLIVAGTGDNPSSACATIRRGSDLVISLGTSHTMFGYTNSPPLTKDQNADEYEGHTFVSPVLLTPHDESVPKYMKLICFKNGANVRNLLVSVFDNSWINLENYVSDQLQERRVKRKDSALDVGFFYLLPEITPHTGSSCGLYKMKDESIEKVDHLTAEDALMLYESQCISLKLHARRAGLLNDDEREGRRLIVTGGASESQTMLFILAQVFGCRVYILKDAKDSSAMGAACRAVYAHKYLLNNSNTPSSTYLQMIDSKLPTMECVAYPNEQLNQWYTTTLESVYAAKEESLLRRLRQ